MQGTFEYNKHMAVFQSLETFLQNLKNSNSFSRQNILLSKTNLWPYEAKELKVCIQLQAQLDPGGLRFLALLFTMLASSLVKFFSCNGKMGLNGFRLMAPPAKQSHCKNICSFSQSSSRFLRFTLVKPCSHNLLLKRRWEGEKRWEESEPWTLLPHHMQ